jgi:hypothetical protein
MQLTAGSGFSPESTELVSWCCSVVEPEDSKVCPRNYV